MPIKVIHGKYQRACLVILSALEGTELNGLEITNRLIQKYSARPAFGNSDTFPAMNVYGFSALSSHIAWG